MMAIKEIMKKDFSKLSSLDSVESAVELMEKMDDDYLLIEEKGEIKGVITSRELAGYPPSRLIIDCAIKPIGTVSEETLLDEALRLLEEKKVSFLVILNKKDMLTGVVNREILISFLCRELEKLTKEKEEYIIKRKKVEETLRESKKFAESLIASMKDGFSILDTQGVHLNVNPALCHMTGFTREELIGTGPPHPYWPKGEYENIEKTFQKILKGEFEDFELIFKRKNGERFPVIVSPSRVTDKGGNVISYFATVKDITEHRKAEEAEKARIKLSRSYSELKTLDKLKDEFLTIAAHELKTPLTPILAYINLILKNKGSELSNKEREQLEICRRNAIRLKNLVSDISSVSKLKTKAMKFKMKPMKIENVVNDVIQELKPAARDKHLRLIANIEPKLPIIKGDAERLAQALSKMLENSIKFTDKGRITVSAEKEKNKILVKISDTGIGIRKKNIPKLFTKFFQTDVSPSRKTHGTGLGLAICKGIVEAHNGEICAESEGLCKGSTFTVTLPVKK